MLGVAHFLHLLTQNIYAMSKALRLCNQQDRAMLCWATLQANRAQILDHYFLRDQTVRAASTRDRLLAAVEDYSEKILCSICYEQRNKSDIYSDCSHPRIICKFCLRRTIVAQIENGATVIRCSCNMQDHFVSELAIFELLTDVEASTLSLYCSLKERREVLADRMRHYCPGVGCSAIVSAAGVHDWQATCSSCNLKFCRTCYSEHSPALPCALSKSSTGVGSILLSFSTKRCPECRVYIEKNEGCSHMTCWNCRHEFCWYCKREWRGGCNPLQCIPTTVMRSECFGDVPIVRQALQISAVSVGLGLGAGAAGLAMGAAVPAVIGYGVYKAVKKLKRKRRGLRTKLVPFYRRGSNDPFEAYMPEY